MRKLLFAAGLCVTLAGCGGTKHAVSIPTTTDANGCAKAAYPATAARTAATPASRLSLTKHYAVTFTTSCGNFTIRLDPAQSPHAAASFASLVQHHFYDATVVHRIWVDTLIQAGDPTGSGTGGPGYSTLDTPPKTARYTRGVVAMAKTAADQAGTAGSQFFVVTAADAGFTPDYAIVGRVIDGMSVVDRIDKLGDANQSPSQTVEIVNADLKVSG